MNFDSRFAAIEQKQKELEKLIENLSVAYNEAREFTENFLKCCERHGINLVSVATRTKKIDKCATYPFGCEDSVFAEGLENGWPTIWAVAEEIGIGCGCGNGNQHQITRNAKSKLIDGVYELKDGVWMRLGENEV